MNKNNARTVWSSEDGDLRKKNQNPANVKSLPSQQQTIYLHRESSGRSRSPVSVIKNLVLSDEDMKALAKLIKQKCGVGGTVKNGVIEIQGEQRQRIAQSLQGLGYKVKIAGG